LSHPPGDNTLTGTPTHISARTISPLPLKSAVVFTPASSVEGYILLQECCLVDVPGNLGFSCPISLRFLDLDLLDLSEWDKHPPTNVNRANSVLSSAIALAAKKAITKRSRKTHCAWWCPEVEQAVTRHRQAQEDLRAHPDDDDKAETFQMASREAQKTIKEAKTRLWQEFGQIAEVS